MSARGLMGVGWIAIGLLAGVAPAAAAEPVGDPPAAMYEPDTVDVIRLTLPPESKQKLEEAPEAEYVEGTFSIASTEGTPQTTGPFSPPAMVGIRLKGGVGSFRELSEKAAFKIKFNFENSKGEKGKKYLGLKKLTLNNMVQDKSFIHERLAYEALRSAGVPSPRTGYAYVEVNGEDFGLHLNIEALDDVALEKRFGPFGHLYEAVYGTDVDGTNPGFEIDEGDEVDTSDLEALIAAVNGTEPADFFDRVEPHTDLSEMIMLWAVEHYVGHWDGYIARNNYYLLSDTEGRFQMLPWGTDQTWGEHVGFDEGYGLLFTKCLEDASCAARYRKALRFVQAAVDHGSFDSLATEMAALLKPWEDMEQVSPRRGATTAQIAAAVQSTRDYIAAEPGYLADWLKGKPEVFATHVSVVVQPSSLPADGMSTAIATATVTDVHGEPVAGDWLDFTSPDPAVGFGGVVDNGDGTYTTEITSSTSAGAKAITATDVLPDPDVAGGATLAQTPLGASDVSVTLQPSAIVADGASTSTATATVTDAHGNAIVGHQLEFASTDLGEQIGQVVDHGDGTYTAQITSSTTVGAATITASDASAAPLSGSAMLTQAPAAADVSVTLQPSAIVADGTSTSTATATVTDAHGNAIVGHQLEFASTDLGEQIGQVVDHGDGTYTAQITSSTTVGAATITASDASAAPLSGSAMLTQAPLQLTTDRKLTDETHAATQAPAASPPALIPPGATLTRKPDRKSRDRRPTFVFASDQGSTFQCRLDRHPFRSCRSPYTLPRLALGAHVFYIRALSATGAIGLPTSYRFVVKGAARHSHRTDHRHRRSHPVVERAP